MNKISKELRIEISEKVYKALRQSDDIVLTKANSKYKQQVAKISKLHSDYEMEVKNFSNELKSQGLVFQGYDENKIELSSRYDREVADDIINKIIVQLQYSKELDFLKSIDSLIAEQVPKQEKEIRA